MIKQIIFDLDGVLVDLVPMHFSAFNDALYSVCGFRLTQESHDQDFNGLPTMKKLEKLVFLDMIDKECIDKIYKLKQQLTDKALDDLMPDQSKIAMLEWLKSQSIQANCVSNAIRSTVLKALENSGLSSYIHLVLSNEDVPFVKPNPSGYLKMMSMTGIGPKDTLIIEDSAVGVIAAIDSGAHVLELTSHEKLTEDNLKKIVVTSGIGQSHKGCPWRFKL